MVSHWINVCVVSGYTLSFYGHDWKNTWRILTHLSPDKIADILQATFSNAFYWRKFVVLSLIIIPKKNGITSVNSFASYRRQFIIRTNEGLVYWCTYAPYSHLGLGLIVTICQHQAMMTSSNGNIFRVTGHLCGKFTGHRWIPLTKASDAELWCFPWSAPE